MKNNNSLVYSSSGLLALLIIVYPVLAYIEADLTSYASFAGPIVAILITGLSVNSKIEGVSQIAKTVERQTNGELKAQFTEVKALINEVVTPTDPPNSDPPATGGSHPFIPGVK